MRKSSSILAVWILGVASLRAGAESKIVLIGHKHDHPYRAHMYLEELKLLQKCLEQTPGVKAIVSDGWPADPELLRGVKALVYYSSPAGDLLLSADHRQQAEALLSENVGLVAIHWGTGASREIGPTYEDLLGGWFNFDFCGLDVSKTKLEMLDPSHPICRGWKEYEIHDELYLNMKLSPRAKPLLKVRAKDKDQVVAWTLEREKSTGGRSFGVTLGHFHENFGIEAFRRMLVNGILWAANIEVPPEGAICKASSEDLKLPAPEIPPRKGERKTIELFDGKSLDGWVGHEKHWSVKDGVIVGKSTEPVAVSTYLLTKEAYSDFRLTATVKLVTSEMHSGIALWGRLAPEKKDPYTYAGHLVMFPSGWGFYDLYGREGLGVDPEPAKKVGKQHDWNQLEILAQGNRIRLVVNGKLVADWRDPEPDRIKTGPIGLQLHSNPAAQEVQFKDLKLEVFPEERLLTQRE